MSETKADFGFSKLSPSEQLDFLKSLIESSTEYSIIAKDLGRTIIGWNEGAKRIYGYEANEIIGKHADILHHPEDVASGKVNAMFEHVQQYGVWSGEVRRIRKNGTHFNALLTITLRKNAKNEVVGYTVISRDLTELQNTLRVLSKLKASEELLQIRNQELAEAMHQALESNRQKSDFLANVSHELRTPLNGIIGFSEILFDGLVEPESPRYKEFLSDIISSSKQLLALINDVLDISKIEAGKMEFNPEKINTTKMLTETRNIFNKQLTEKNIKLDIHVDRSLQHIIIDPRRFKQIIFNFVSNAIKFTPTAGKINIRLIPADTKKDFYLEVQDTGIGISHKDINKLFTKFFQVDPSAAKKYPGTGLGLALVKEIVEAQGGQVGVQSTLGKGSTFFAMLPIFPYHRPVVADKEQEKISTKTQKRIPKVLLIENETKEKSRMNHALMHAGYHVLNSKTVHSELQKQKKYALDAIILDLFTSNLSGWENIRSLRRKQTLTEAVPIVITATLEKPINISFRIHDFLIKPVSPEILMAAVEWVGVNPNAQKTLLIIDNDDEAIAMAEKTLGEEGIRVVSKTNKISALLALEQERPDAILLDPFMSGMDALEFLRFYHQNRTVQETTPLIVWMRIGLNQEERMQLITSLEAIRTGDDLEKHIIAELKPFLPPTKA